MVVSHLDGKRVTEVLRVVVTDFFKFIFMGQESKLLKCDNEGYPEVTCATTCISSPEVTCLPT